MILGKIFTTLRDHLSHGFYSPRGKEYSVSERIRLGVLCVMVIMLSTTPLAAEDMLELDCGVATVYFSAQNGAIVRVVDKNARVIPFQSDSLGLFRVAGDRKSAPAHVSAKSFGPQTAQCRVTKQDGKIIAHYEKDKTTIQVTASAGNGYLDFQTEVQNHGTPFVIKQVYVPGKLVFETDKIKRVIMPGNAMFGVGLAFEKEFFMPQKDFSWERRNGGTDAYERLYGGKCRSYKAHQTPVSKLSVTPDGERIFPAELVAKLNAQKRKVTKASAPGQYDEILIDSPNGPFFCMASLGGKGRIGRFGVWHEFNDFKYYDRNGKILFVEPVKRVIAYQAEKEKGRRSIVLFDLKNGPPVGVFSKIPVAKWRQELKAFALAHQLELLSATSPEMMLELLRSGNVLAVVNPYGEGIPIGQGGRPQMIEAIRAYVKNGGYWFETAGLSFWSELIPKRYQRYSTEYPSAAADLQHVDFADNGVSLYSVQPLPKKAWDKNFLLHSSTLSCDGEKKGTMLDRAFMVWIPAGKNWTSPVVRLRFGKVEDNIRKYVAENGVYNKLENKMPLDLLKAFKESLLIKGEGYDFRYTPEVINALPVPCMLHVDSYMRAGFDLSYPDHFPFAKNYQKYPELLKKLKKTGRYMLPYSNSSFWCETNPRPPTFAKAGMAPLLRGIDGKPNREVYGWGSNPNQGFSTCLWHPEVRKANDKTIHDFLTIFPVPILFQDQIGVRLNLYDFNTAAPDPAASYCTGLINQALTDSKRIPIATEGGYVHLANAESAFYGMAFSLIPTPHRGSAMKDYSSWLPEQWRVFPLAQYALHDVALMGNHNSCGYFYNMECLSWNLGLGYSLIYKPDHEFQKSKITLILEPERYNWMHYLAAVQKYVIAPIVGEALAEFQHDRISQNDAGVIRTRYGSEKIVANLNPEPLQLSDRVELAPYGFYVTSPTLRAGYLSKCGGEILKQDPVAFIAAEDAGKTVVAVYAKPGARCMVELPVPRRIQRLRLEDGREIDCEVKEKHIFFTAPASSRYPAYQGRNLLKGVLLTN